MMARIWWKEARTLWPLWTAVAVIATAVAGLYWRYGEVQDLSQGVLLSILPAISLLYAFAVGSAAFAGERETKTLLFLDALPVDRRALWKGKTSFAYATAILLGLLCLFLALALTWLARVTYGAPPVPFGSTVPVNDPRPWLWINRFVIIMVEAVAWGLFWSALKENVLLVAILAIVSVAAGEMVLSPLYGITGSPEDLSPTGNVPPTWLIRGVFAAFALIASWVLVTRAPRPERIPNPRPSVGSVARSLRRSTTRKLAKTPRSFGFLHLVWETFREARGTWLRLAAAYLFGLGCLVYSASSWASSSQGWESFAILNFVLASILGLVAGAHVFGIANHRGDRRFLAHHGVHPGMIWLARTLVWIIPTLATTGFVDLVFFGFEGNLPRPHAGLAWLAIPGAFVIGQLCGMAVSRIITATVVGILGLLVVLLPLVVLEFVQMLTPALAVLALLGILGISWAWSNDWLLDRQGPRRWLKLAGLVILLVGPGFTLYINERAHGVPDYGRPFIGGLPEQGTVSPELDAAVGYREAARAYRGEGISPVDWRTIQEQGDRDWDPGEPATVAFWKENQTAIDLARKASSLPSANFVRPTRLDSALDPVIQEHIRSLANVLNLDGRERLSRGDLSGSWADVLALFHMARHVADRGDSMGRLVALGLEERGLMLAFDWTGDRGQTPQTLRTALETLQERSILPPIGDAVIADAALHDQTLDLPAAELRIFVMGRSPRAQIERLLNDVVFSPWERERARRVLLMVFAKMYDDGMRQPWGRVGSESLYRIPPFEMHEPGNFDHQTFSQAMLDHALATTPLARLLMPASDAILAANSTALIRERALETILALRLFQLEHGGSYPKSLTELVPSTLPALPIDPFSGQPFRYLPSLGQRAARLGRGTPVSIQPANLVPTRPGQYILYSVGPNGVDDHADKDFRDVPIGSAGDILFPMPDTEPHDAPIPAFADPFSPPAGLAPPNDGPPAGDRDGLPAIREPHEPPGAGAVENPGASGGLGGGGGPTIKPFVEIQGERLFHQP